jgi:hypothetical protein
MQPALNVATLMKVPESAQPTRMMKANCYHCGQPMSYDKEDGGRKIKCPACHNAFRLPGGESTLAIYQGSSAPLPPPLPGGLPTEVAVELAEEEILDRRQVRLERSQAHQWLHHKRQMELAELESNQPGALGTAINGVCVLMILPALFFAHDVSNYLEAACGLSILGGIGGTASAAWGAFRPNCNQLPGWIGLGLGMLLFFLIPFGFKVAKESRSSKSRYGMIAPASLKVPLEPSTSAPVRIVDFV